MSAAAPTHTAGRFVGQAILRKEDPRLLTGRGRYTDDVELPRMLHAHFVRSDLARAKITRLDVGAARELPGVVAVLTAEDLNSRVAVSMYPSMFQGAEDFMALRPVGRQFRQAERRQGRVQDGQGDQLAGAEQLRRVAREIGEDGIGARALESDQALQHHAILVEPAAL